MNVSSSVEQEKNTVDNINAKINLGCFIMIGFKLKFNSLNIRALIKKKKNSHVFDEIHRYISSFKRRKR